MLSSRACCSAGDWYCHECHPPQNEHDTMRIAGEATKQPMAAAAEAPDQSNTTAAEPCNQATEATPELRKAGPCAASPSDSTSARDAAAAMLMDIATSSCMPPVICKTEHGTTAHGIPPVFPEHEPPTQIASVVAPIVKDERCVTDAHLVGTKEELLEEQEWDGSSFIAELSERAKRADLAGLLRENAKLQVEPHLLI